MHAHKSILLIGLIFVARSASSAAETEKRVIWTDKPVVMLPDQPKPMKSFQLLWDSSVYPLGNGRLGSVSYGEPRKETIQFGNGWRISMIRKTTIAMPPT